MKRPLLAIIGAVTSLIGTSTSAQYALDYPMSELHTKAGLDVVVAQCRPDLPVIHFVASKERGKKLYPLTSTTQCVPKSGTQVLLVLCDFATNTCKAEPTPQLAKDLEAAFRQGTLSKGQRL